MPAAAQVRWLATGCRVGGWMWLHGRVQSAQNCPLRLLRGGGAPLLLAPTCHTLWCKVLTINDVC